MKTLRNSTSALKTFIAAGAMLLATLGAAAQQEVAPDHFDRSPTVNLQKVRPAKARKAAEVSHKSAQAVVSRTNKRMVVAKNAPAEMLSGK